MNVELTIRGDISKLHVGPDDVLLVKLEGPITQDQFEHIQLELQRKFKDLEWVDRILFIGGTKAEVSVVGSGK